MTVAQLNADLEKILKTFPKKSAQTIRKARPSLLPSMILMNLHGRHSMQ